ncbi:hypothetical protein T440DRAFT_399911 [Plenodomus tracheiphilus IPT5]|uniref:Aminoglycoside phosphotransferase domain-containing protein n=1 Tax=Plenodomus tracheiphilus IPT5 TaxID=1408161 RepID=A0A6A7B4F4_9PLEO|nr:hypothetical protein T440DRAFT_399911 [Plenodomus tracheiphilus IPT5]
MSTEATLDFWTRQGLRCECKGVCIGILRKVYGEYRVEEFGEQGYCSFTLLATPLGMMHHHVVEDDVDREYGGYLGREKKEFVVQLRPARYSLDLEIARAACATYPLLAPKIRYLDLDLPGELCAYEIQRLNGTPFSRLQPHRRTLDSGTCQKLERLVTSFAEVIAQSWPASSKDATTSRHIRADSPMDHSPDMLSQCPGKVGSSITDRLRKLAAELPDAQLRDRAQSISRAVRGMTDYPVVLNHGDLIPSNILVDEKTWEIIGLVDWAEAEVLPFGTCLYGLEHLLGYMETSNSDGSSGCDAPLIFLYFDNAANLRNLFWTHLLECTPELRSRKDDVEVMRDMGVLLWRGIAWDDGAIDRVANEMDDAEELAHLRAFLNASQEFSGLDSS